MSRTNTVDDVSKRGILIQQSVWTCLCRECRTYSPLRFYFQVLACSSRLSRNYEIFFGSVLSASDTTSSALTFDSTLWTLPTELRDVSLNLAYTGWIHGSHCMRLVAYILAFIIKFSFQKTKPKWVRSILDRQKMGPNRQSFFLGGHQSKPSLAKFATHYSW